ncbi:uncharacterized protein VICG_01736 [Vittaforma corneae ATCC 50505]|uniref:Glycolipid 2-alpha-mannosyltransferase n=1 Tax=Vittaforma corneae (strain ATCC 50505) TaxID=993615 RepID=L2GLT2_VITCO|nr:uncharacterized protein VICG_01736 [Vittaforma corneae ATCC 50505]ELA41247.1 hypothetical protein VICG_01736 [Vittaforma corneae ATCC 50505]
MHFLLYLISAFCRRKDSVILILCRNEDKDEIAKTITNFEERFNARYKYPYVFLNDKDWDNDFKDKIKSVTKSQVKFGKVPSEDWDMPKSIDAEKAKTNWKTMAMKGVPYAEKESYHNMCRFYSRSFYYHDLVQKYKYYWRIEPGVRFRCKIPYDPFEIMEEKGYKYGFTITLFEFKDSIPTLYDSTLEFKRKYSHLIPKDKKTLQFMFENRNYNGCHFWSNFEIASFELFRSKSYTTYVGYLNQKGGFYYERWGDAPVHSLAVAMFLDMSEVHFFEEIGYTHPPFTHCPTNGIDCDCKPEENFDNNQISCLPKYRNDTKSQKTPADGKVANDAKNGSGIHVNIEQGKDARNI